MTIISTSLADVRFALQRERIRQKLSVPNTQSACVEGKVTVCLKRVKPVLTEAQIAWVRARGGQNLRVMQMAHELGVHHATIVYTLKPWLRRKVAANFKGEQ